MDLNKFDVAVKRMGVRYLALIRLPRDGYLKPILGKGGQPNRYNSELDAYKAAIKHVMDYLNGNYLRCGEVVGNARKAAEALFKPLEDDEEDI